METHPVFDDQNAVRPGQRCLLEQFAHLLQVLQWRARACTPHGKQSKLAAVQPCRDKACRGAARKCRRLLARTQPAEGVASPAPLLPPPPGKRVRVCASYRAVSSARIVRVLALPPGNNRLDGFDVVLGEHPPCLLKTARRLGDVADEHVRVHRDGRLQRCLGAGAFLQVERALFELPESVVSARGSQLREGLAVAVRV